MALVLKSGWKLRLVAGWLVIVALIFAPLSYGTTAWWSESTLAGLLVAAFVCLLISRGLNFAEGVEIAVLYILVSGWWMVFNAHQLFDPVYREFFYLAEPLPGAPGTIDRLASGVEMVRITGLLAGFLSVRALAVDAIWRRRFLRAIALSGLLVAVLGIGLKLAGPSVLPFIWGPKPSHFEFALYRYHGNAGSFLNLAWPAALALCILPDESLGARKSKWFWAGAVLLIFVAIQMNMSKAGLAIAGLLIGLFAVLAPHHWPKKSRREMWTLLAIFAIGSVFITACLSPLLPSATAWKRWESLPGDTTGSIGVRQEVQQLAWRMVPDSGWFGFGPGAFEAAVLDYQKRDDARSTFRFDEAHEDYLQTVIAWGIGGTLAWSYLLFGGLMRIWRRCGFTGDIDSITSSWPWRVILLALTGVLIHALYDFPLQIDSIRWPVLVFLGLAWANPKSEERTSTSSS